MDNIPNLEYLLQGHIAGSLSDQEKLTLYTFLQTKEGMAQWGHQIETFYASSAVADANYRKGDLEEMIRKILASEQPATPAIPIQRRISARWWSAAAAILVLCVGTYFWAIHRTNKVGPPVSFTTDIAAPGGTKTSLTLSNGSTILLDSAGDGVLAKDGGAEVKKVAAGRLSYQAGEGNSPEIYFNTLSTAKGGSTSVVLSDGTRVWLNALSSIKFPTAFSGGDRTVEVTGEAYFEVSPNRKPFRVKNGEAEILVLGTHFNVNAYNDESTLTLTLLEGKVSISSAPGLTPTVLQPGEQAIYAANGPIQTKQNADLDKSVAWVNNEFDFEKDDVGNIMRQLARWYDVDIRYAGSSAAHYTGHITRTAPLSQVLSMFARLGYVRFEIKGRTISIIPTGKKDG